MLAFASFPPLASWQWQTRTPRQEEEETTLKAGTKRKRKVSGSFMRVQEWTSILDHNYEVIASHRSRPYVTCMPYIHVYVVYTLSNS